MQSVTELLIHQPFKNRVLSDRQLDRLIGGSPARRHGLVNRALKANELIRIQRGLYVLPPKFRSEPLHPFVIAQALEPGSYISFETALGAHGWIPEAVSVTASVVTHRKSSTLEHPTLGTFTFHPLALHRERFLELVERRQLASQTALMATPIRALMDLVVSRKLNWQGMEWLTHGMRIEERSLRTVSRDQIRTLLKTYKQKRPLAFLSALARELGLD